LDMTGLVRPLLGLALAISSSRLVGFELEPDGPTLPRGMDSLVVSPPEVICCTVMVIASIAPSSELIIMDAFDSAKIHSPPKSHRFQSPRGVIRQCPS
jgi:hypothetical protein